VERDRAGVLVSANELIEKALDRSTCAEADLLCDDGALAEREERRDRPDAVGLGEKGRLADVDDDHPDAALVAGREVGEDWRETAAGAAGGPAEVDDDGSFGIEHLTVKVGKGRKNGGFGHQESSSVSRRVTNSIRDASISVVRSTCECRPEVVLELVRAGDALALDRVTRCYGRHLLAVGRRACGDGETARDAVQDALASATEHLGSFRATGSVEGWLVRMVENACRTRRRGRKNRPDWNLALEDERVASREPEPEDAAARGELATALDAALSALGPADRAILLLSEVDGWTAPELSRELGLSPEAIRARLARARRKLRASLRAPSNGWL
jgi:RNA polymerase sigma-70 factor (ECF subfamily)